MKLDRDALIVAFDDNSLERSYYLDRDSGKVFNLLEDHHDPETEEIAWQIEADGGRRFIQIPKLSMEEMMQEQDAFLESLEAIPGSPRPWRLRQMQRATEGVPWGRLGCRAAVPA